MNSSENEGTRAYNFGMVLLEAGKTDDAIKALVRAEKLGCDLATSALDLIPAGVCSATTPGRPLPACTASASGAPLPPASHGPGYAAQETPHCNIAISRGKAQSPLTPTLSPQGAREM